ncbi:CDP-alcohol phosphatidyltransferase family protein [Kroppenstedtia eburnea]|uniref:CDP-diacylglycerol--glycerol-3-phosphate 3-phosphatidyltransferase n=1 Tax=Kroppenstedtia eburnea TaxID=714067 RepID=A0A1N7JP41_9BACL|nr:CDP-alcohol phosphatidyltransferase family protein [Kroppenstedtia eburnea]EGK10702.1 CDP-diacylglycerol-glycerol-3-phosphate 3-phosphatidyltransferase [Desmospora sp. 8437]QKI83490.1 CDP-diacylglycerol--glycerol-3-phosphate 3-phosphatidyltransferase [Kroppenstedtia eburnea]SIS51075.1 cardiolipin synthase [Kroppenstedtia eburnea]
MNLPNTVTLIRFTLIPIYLTIFFSDLPYRMQWAFGVLLLAGITDVIDGYLARRHSQVTQLGIMLDPLADKMMMLAVFLSLLISQRISIPAAVAIFLRDLGMIVASAFFHFRGKLTVPANIMGKLTTVLYYVALFLLMFDHPIGTEFLWGVIIFSFVTSLVYLIQFNLLNERSM